jgi:hypothetical protein
MRGGALPMLAQQQQASLLAMLNRLDAATVGLRNAVERTNALLCTIALQDAAVVLDLLQQAGHAEQRFFATAVNVAATATAAGVVDLQPGTGRVGFWRRLDVEPDQSRIFSMQLTIDGRPELTDPSVVPGSLIPTSVWLPFYARFLVDFTNNDAIGAHTINVKGIRVFLDAHRWQEIRNALVRGINTLCGVE